jgi:transposase-like protein
MAARATKNLSMTLKRRILEMKKQRRKFTAEEKLKAVLAVWSERRSVSELCTDMEISANQFGTWQNRALEALLKALDPGRSREKPPLLSGRMERLLSRHRQSSGSPLDDRLKQLQKAKKN